MRASLVCPDTGGPVSFDVVEVDATSLARDWKRSILVTCPYCGAQHMIRYREAYVDGVLTGFQGGSESLMVPARAPDSKHHPRSAGKLQTNMDG